MKIHTPVRLTAIDSGETKCFVFVDSIEKARLSLQPYLTTVVASYPFINAFGVHCSVHKLSDLTRLPCVKTVSPHSNVTTCLTSENITLNTASLHKNLGIGKNITVAVIDTGVYPHLDFVLGRNRVLFEDFIAGKALPYDDNGHGTAVASILCGSGLRSGGAHAGVAPGVNLIALKAIGAKGEGGTFAIVEAMQWIYDNAQTYNIKVACMSFGAEPIYNGLDPLSVGAEALWKKGIVVVASAGNDGPASHTIKSPGVNPHIITVGGASIEKQEDTQEHAISSSLIKIPDFSSRGPAGKFNKPDLVAPSVDIDACSSASVYQSFTGTSMAAPIVAGVAALVVSKYPEFSPDKVKEILLNSCIKLPFPKNWVGEGLLDLDYFAQMDL